MFKKSVISYDFHVSLMYSWLRYYFSTPLSITKQVLREEGIRGLFRGLVPTFAREMPGYFFFFGGYELSKKFLSGNKTESELSNKIF